ncbi:MAG: translocation/assembly module TamB domain-containing protein [Candidatus Hydrogenedentes bacterium]|nr:translocation/assembly module TamB domain-containing protein [Candidatus Hydrogenedentota bacterium]
MARQPDTPTPPARKRVRLRRALIFLVVLLLVLLAIPQTPFGKRAIVSLIARQVESRTPFSLSITGVRGWIPSSLEVDEISLHDAKGEWLTVYGVRARGNIAQMLRGRLVLESLHVDSVDLFRRPFKPRKFKVPQLPGLRWWPGVENAALSRFHLHEEVAGVAAEFEAAGHLDWNGWGMVPGMDVAARRVDSPTATAAFSMSLENGMPSLTCTVQDEELIPRMLRTEGGFDLNLSGRGTREEWSGHIRAASGGLELLDGSLRLESAEETRISGNLALAPSVVPRLERISRTVGDHVQLDVEVHVRQDGNLQLQQLTLTGELLKVQVDGSAQLVQRMANLSGEASWRNKPGSTVGHWIPGLEDKEVKVVARVDGLWNALGVSLSATADDHPFVNGRGTLGLGNRPEVEGLLTTSLPAEWLGPVPWAPALAGELQAEFAFSFDDGVLGVERFAAQGNNQTVILSGSMDFGKMRPDFQFSGSVTNPVWAEAIRPGLAVAAASLDGALHGGDTATELSATVSVKGAALDAIRCEDIHVKLNAGHEGAFGQWEQGVRLALEGRLAGVQNTGLPAFDLQTTIGGLFSPETGLGLDSVLVSLPGWKTDWRGTAAYSMAGDARIDGVLRVEAFEELPMRFDRLLSGGMTANTLLEGKIPGAYFSGVFRAELERFQGLPEPAGVLAGSTPKFEATWAFASNRVTFSAFSVEGANGALNGSGNYDLGDRLFSLDLSASIPDMTHLSPTLGRPVSGSFSANAALAGNPGDFTCKGSVKTERVLLQGLSLPTMNATVDLAHLPVAAQGPVLLEAALPQGLPKLTAGGRFVQGNNSIALTGMTIKNGQNSAAGNISYDMGKKLLDASFDADLPDLSPLGAFLGHALGGGAKAKGTLTRSEGRIALKSDFSVSGLSTPWADAENAEGMLAFDSGDPESPVRVSLNARDITRDTLKIDRAKLTAQGTAGLADLEISATGSAVKSVPLTLSVSGTASLSERTATLPKFALSFDKATIGASQPLMLSLSDNVTRIGGTFSVNGGSIGLDASVSSGGPSASVHWNALPLELARMAAVPLAAGTTSGTAQLGGEWSAATLSLDAGVDGLLLEGAAGEAPPLRASLEANAGGNGIAFKTEGSMEDAAAFDIEGSLAMPLSLRPFSPSPGPGTRMTMAGNATASLTRLAGAMALLDHVVKGEAAARFNMDGTLGEPKLEAECLLKNGRYENLVTGTVLEDLTAKLTSEGSTLRLVECGARAGSQGTLNGSGGMTLSFTGGHALDFVFVLNNAHLLRMDYADATANGRVTLTGTVSNPLLSGKLTVAPVNVTLPERLPGMAVEVVEVTEINHPSPAPPEKAAAVLPAPAIGLNLDLDFPGRFFVRGPVLDSEWRGSVQARGTVREPKLAGSFTAVRGHASMLGSRFELADSTIALTEGDLKNPRLNILTVSRTQGMTARMTLSGPLSDARMDLTSEPSMPQDEILANLLFRRNLSQISPVQAVQLARFAALFAGRMNVPQLMSGTLRLPGIDQFDIRTGATEKDAVLGVGKYLTDNVYVEVEQGVTAESGRVSAEVEVNPNVSVKADAGVRSRSGVGVFWKRDY